MPKPNADAATKANEVWSLRALQPINSLGFSSSETMQLILAHDTMTLKQGQHTLPLQIVAWENPDYAKIRFQSTIGFFNWDVIPGDKRYDDRDYACGKQENAPRAMTRVEETQQQKVVTIHLEKTETKEVTLHLVAAVPEQSFWVQTGATPVKLCPQGGARH